MKYVMILVMLLLIPVVYASNYDVYSVRMYTKGIAGEEVRISGIDEDGGDFELPPGAELTIEVKIENLNETVAIKKGKLRVYAKDLDDGSDFKETSDYFDIGVEDMETERFTVIIPEEAEEDEYDMDLEVHLDWDDGVEEIHIINYELQIDDDNRRISSSGSGGGYIPVEDILLNMSHNCNKYFQNIETFYQQNTKLLADAGNLSYDAVTCLANKQLAETKQTDIIFWQTEHNNLEGKYNELQTELDTCEQDSQQKANSLSICTSTRKTEEECKSEIASAVGLAKPGILHWAGWIGFVLCIGYWYFKIQKPQQKYATKEQDMLDELG